MTAETLTGTRAARTLPVSSHGLAGTLRTAYGSYSVAANVEDGDIFEMCILPAGAIVVGGQFWCTDMDTNATETLDLDVGYAANGVEAAAPTAFVNSGVLVGDGITELVPAGANLRLFNMAAGAVSLSAETVIQVEANAAAATFAAGTMFVRVDYVMN
ncbi:MAG: hypothetical protein WAZ50_02015 [Minisyncoccia bacterium]